VKGDEQLEEATFQSPLPVHSAQSHLVMHRHNTSAIIMMSQRRQEAKDRIRSLNDYRVNLKTELEIRHLHEKTDHLLFNQWQRLSEIQELQIEIMHNQAASAGP
jgi:uncharacterized membrane protein